MDRTTEELICDLQAQVSVLRVGLRALARTHPDPAQLLRAWREALGDSAADASVPSSARQSETLAERRQAFAEDWTAELVELAVLTTRMP